MEGFPQGSNSPAILSCNVQLGTNPHCDLQTENVLRQSGQKTQALEKGNRPALEMVHRSCKRTPRWAQEVGGPACTDSAQRSWGKGFSLTPLAIDKTDAQRRGHILCKCVRLGNVPKPQQDIYSPSMTCLLWSECQATDTIKTQFPGLSLRTSCRM